MLLGRNPTGFTKVVGFGVDWSFWKALTSGEGFLGQIGNLFKVVGGEKGNPFSILRF